MSWNRWLCYWDTRTGWSDLQISRGGLLELAQIRQMPLELLAGLPCWKFVATGITL